MPQHVLLALLTIATLASFALNATAAPPTTHRSSQISPLQQIAAPSQLAARSNRAATNGIPFNCHAGDRSMSNRSQSAWRGYGSDPSYGYGYGYPSYGYSGYSAYYPSYSMPVSPFVSARAFGFGP